MIGEDDINSIVVNWVPDDDVSYKSKHYGRIKWKFAKFLPLGLMVKEFQMMFLQFRCVVLQ